MCNQKCVFLEGLLGKYFNFEQLLKEGWPLPIVAPFVKKAKRQRPSPSSLSKDEGAVGVVFFSFWSLMGNAYFGDGFPFGVEGISSC